MSGEEESYADYGDYGYNDSEDPLHYSGGSGGSFGSWWSGLWNNNVQRSDNYSNRVEEIQRQAEQEYQQRLKPLEERQRQFESSLNNLSSNIGRVERDMLQRDSATQERIRQQHREFNTQLRQQRHEYRGMIQEQDRRMTRMIAAERQQRESAINNLQKQISQIVANANRKQDIASTFVVDLSKILNQVNQLPHQRFAPGQLDAVRRHVQDAKSSLNANIPEAALSTAQNAYWQLVDLRSLVLQKETEYILMYQTAREEVRTILEEAHANRNCKIVPKNGSEDDKLDLEVDYWTKGKLAQLEKELRSIEQRLVSEEKRLSVDEVKKILLSLETIRGRMGQIVGEARDNIMASQLRFNLAEMVVKAMGSQGYGLEAGVYEGNDPRNAYVAKVKNRSGSEVVTVISPMPDNCGKNRISIHSYDETYVGEETLRQRAKDVVSLLAQDGLQVAPPTCKGGADRSYQDINAVASGRRLSGTKPV